MELGATGMAVAHNVKRIREAANMTYTEVSKALAGLNRPISPLAVRRIEDGERRVDVDDLMALALALRVAPVTLLFPSTRGKADKVLVTGLESPVAAEALWKWMVAESPIVPWESDMELFAFFATAVPEWQRHWFGNALRRMAEEATAQGGERASRMEDMYGSWLSRFGPNGDD